MIEYESLAKSNEPFISSYEEEFAKTLKKGYFILGDNVGLFEQEFAAYQNLNRFVGMASGLDALTLAVELSGVPKGSEIIVPANTYIATILAIMKSGCVPVLVEPDLNSYNIDPLKIEAAITEKTKAMMIVHLYGRPCDMDPIMEIKKRHNLILIEDCAQAHGAKYKNQSVGTFGEFAAFSFYPTKNLGALGDAGGLAFQDSNLVDKVKMMRNYGSLVKYQFDEVGYNSRLDEVQAAFLRVKLRSLNQINENKRKHAKLYYAGLSDKFVLPENNAHYEQVHHIFNIRHSKRDQLKDFLMSKGIRTEIHYPIAPHKQKALPQLNEMSFPISEEIHRTTLSLPISWYHTAEDIERVISTLNSFTEK